MKNIAIFVIMLSSFLQGCTHQDSSAWEELYPQISSQIVVPVFPSVDFDITAYGAVANDPAVLNHMAINKAIEACNAKGGGRVVVPSGVWHTGPITLKSNVELHVQDGATLMFTTERSVYPLVLTRWEGVDCYNYQPMIYAHAAENIAITGNGVIDGGATHLDWWAMHGSTKHGWKEGIVSQKIGRPILLQWNEDQTPVEERRLGEGFGMRPQLINLHTCKNVLIQDVTLLRSPFWVIHPLLCQNLTVRRVSVQNDGPNGDGCDPESCRNVLFEDCDFDTGDDCIAIKSGRNGDGRRWGVPSENIIVRRCRMKNGHGGVVIGSEISGGFRNLFVENCQMDSPLLDRVIRIKTNTCRGGIIENIWVRNIEVGQCDEAVLKINLAYDPNEKCARGFRPTVRNVNLENVVCSQSRYGVMITALDDSVNVYDITLKNCLFDGVEHGNFVSGKVGRVTFDNVMINGVQCTGLAER